jgi:signal transduction histidine kinase
VGSGFRSLARALLLAPPAPAGAPVREMLAESLGDRSLSIAYWLPDREIFVDDRGRPVSLPGAGSGRAWTAVEREGQRVAAIVHDAELDATPELVHAAASAAALAIDNERLKADLRARLEELRHSRRRIVEAADDARRRIERDLHDGAQQQLVSLALDLRLLRAQLKDQPELAATVEELTDKLNAALAELRELARGIHPAVLSDHGLVPAVHVLVERASLPIECDLAFEGRLPAPIEAAAYFVVAEGLTNVVKYANATHARVSLRRRGDVLEVVVADDGVGGASIERGSGLRGLSDRLAALEGELAVDSILGEGTRLTATIPIAAAET